MIDTNSEDEFFLREAIVCAQLAAGFTFPNPCVGCILVADMAENSDDDNHKRNRSNRIVGRGFHPRAGFPHAEVFALLEAAGRVESGVAAAKVVLKKHQAGSDDDLLLLERVQQLASEYASGGGPDRLFGIESLYTKRNQSAVRLTAYVTLEPCCYFGRTPPCAQTLISAKVVKRVVLGAHDPNPRVDGGGVQQLRNAGIQVDFVASNDLRERLNQLLGNFPKRIAPSRDEQLAPLQVMCHDHDKLNTLQKLATQKRADQSLATIEWKDQDAIEKHDVAIRADSTSSMILSPQWLERIDTLLWEQEFLVLEGLDGAVLIQPSLLAEKIAEQLQACVSQFSPQENSLLLYRPCAVSA